MFWRSKVFTPGLLYTCMYNNVIGPYYYILPLSLYLNMQLDDSTVLKEKVATCHLKRLGLSGGSTLLLAVLSGVQRNSSITEVDIESKTMCGCLVLHILIIE